MGLIKCQIEEPSDICDQCGSPLEEYDEDRMACSNDRCPASDPDW